MKTNTYDYAIKTVNTLVWRTVEATNEKGAIEIIKARHKNESLNSFFPYAGPILVK